MASKTGIGIFSKLLTKTSNRLNETLGILKDKMLSARVIDISLNSNYPYGNKRASGRESVQYNFN